MARLINHKLHTAQPVVLFSQNYLPMARVNLRRAAILLGRKPQAPVHPVIAFAGQFWKEQKA